MYVLVIFLPLFAFVYSFFLGSYIGYWVVFLNTLCIFISLIISLFIFYEVVICHFNSYVKLGNWFYALDYNFNFELFFDELSSIMLLIVLTISFFVHFFSISYMREDPNYNKFFSYLTLFTFFMVILILSSNFVQFFLGWEGIGLLSYLLINFWSTRVEANRSAIKAMIINKIGDCAFYFFLVYYFFLFNTFDFIFSCDLILNFIDFQVVFFTLTVQDILVVFLIFAAMAKSAQIGLHVWLPDAMEGPTPVSSLLHAATMVTAGIYLLLRCSWLLDLSSFGLMCILFLGLLTNFFTSLTAVFQKDFKKIIAFSTTSQLAFMFIAIGLSAYNIAFFHLFNHAFFKALLFLCSGVIIHFFNGKQDIRNFTLLTIFLPFTYLSFLIGQLSLIGLPFFSAYYSKDLILQLIVLNNNNIYYFIFWLLNISVILTAFYSIRLISILFWKNYKYIWNNSKIYFFVEYDFYFIIPLLALCVLSIISGYFMVDIFFNKTFYYFKEVFFFSMYKNYWTLLDFLEYSNFVILFFGLCGCALGYYIDKILQKFLLFFNFYIYYVLVLFNKKWFFDAFYYFISNFFINFIYEVIYKILDKSLFEISTTVYIARIFKKLQIFFSTMQYGTIYFYIFLSFIFLILFLTLIFVHQFIYIFIIFFSLELINYGKINIKE